MKKIIYSNDLEVLQYKDDVLIAIHPKQYFSSYNIHVLQVITLPVMPFFFIKSFHMMATQPIVNKPFFSSWYKLGQVET